MKRRRGPDREGAGGWVASPPSWRRPPRPQPRVWLLQVQQELPADLLTLFHTRAVDRFLRTLILYCFYYIQVRRIGGPTTTTRWRR